MIALAAIAAVTLILLAATIPNIRKAGADARAVRAATKTAFTTDAIPQGARDAALKYLQGGGEK